MYDSLYVKFAEQANPQGPRAQSGFRGPRAAGDVLEADGGDGCTVVCVRQYTLARCAKMV